MLVNILISFFLFILPHVFFLETFQIFSVNKFLLILVFTSFFLTVFFYQFISRNPLISIPLSYWKFWGGVSVFCGAVCISAFQSGSMLESFFGGSTRHFGVIFLGGVVFFGMFLLSRNWKKDQWKKYILLPLVYTGVVMGIWAIVQDIFSYPIFSFLNTEALSFRSFAGMGQPNFLAQALLVPFSVGLYFIFFTKKPWKKIFAGLSLGILVWGMWETESRAGILSMGMILGVCILGHLSIRTKNIWWIWGGVIGGIGSIVLLWGSVFFFGEEISFLLGERGASVLARFLFWNESIPLLQENWIWGVGPEMIQSSLAPLLSVSAFSAENFSALPDRTHTVWIDFWLQYGVIPFVLWCILLWKTVLQGVENIRKNDSFSVIALSGILGVLCSWSFGFAVLADTIFVSVLFALIWRGQVQKIILPQWMWLGKVISLPFVILGIWWVIVRVFVSETALFQLSQNTSPHPYLQDQWIEDISKAPFLSDNLITASMYTNSVSHYTLLLQYFLEYPESLGFSDFQMMMIWSAQKGEKSKAHSAFLQGWERSKNHGVFAWGMVKTAFFYDILSAGEFLFYKQEIQNKIPQQLLSPKNESENRFAQKFWKHHEGFITDLFDGRVSKPDFL